MPVRPAESKGAQKSAEDNWRLGLERVGDQLARIARRRDRPRAPLAECQAPLVNVLDGRVQAIWRQFPVGLDGDIGVDGAGQGDHDPDAKGPQLLAQGARVAVNSALGGAVGGAEGVRRDRGDRRQIDDQALGRDEQAGEGLDHGHDPEDIRIKRSPHVLHIQIRGGDGMGAARIVHEDVELASRQPGHLVPALVDAALACDIEREARESGLSGETSQDGRVAGCCDDMQTYGCRRRR